MKLVVESCRLVGDKDVALVAGELVVGVLDVARLVQQQPAGDVLPPGGVLTARVRADADAAGVEVVRDGVAGRAAVGTETELHAVLGDEVDLAEAGHGVVGHVHGGVLAVDGDATLLVGVDRVAADGAADGAGGLVAVVVDADAVLGAVERVLADVVDRRVGHVHVDVARATIHEDTVVGGAVDVGRAHVAGVRGVVVDADLAAGRVEGAADVAADLGGGQDALAGRDRGTGGGGRGRRDCEGNAQCHEQCQETRNPFQGSPFL